MQRKRTVAFVLVAIALLLSVMPFALSEGYVFEAPKIPNGTPKYDPTQPESLIEDQLYARSAILIAADTGEVIFSKDPDRLMFPASTTKIMTVLLALQAGNLDDVVTISEHAVDLPADSSTAKLKAGEEILLLDLLYATMVMSANEGAVAIAEHISGSEAAFVDYMNRAAEAFGCTRTHFANPHGLQDQSHYTTARDLAIIAREAMDNEMFKQICSTLNYTLPKSNLQKQRNLSGETLFLDSSSEFYYQYGTGIKTGSTAAAGYCFVGSASRDGINLISVVLYSNKTNRYADTARLMEYGFSQYASTTPSELYQMNPITIETTNFSLEDSSMGRLTLNIKPIDSTVNTAIVVNKNELDALARNFKQLVIVNYTRNFAAPITYGEVFGTLTYIPSVGNIFEYELTASRSIAIRENAPKSIEQIEAETYADPNPFPSFSLELVLTLSWPLLALLAAIIILRKLLKRRRIKLSKLPNPIRRRFK